MCVARTAYMNDWRNENYPSNGFENPLEILEDQLMIHNTTTVIRKGGIKIDLFEFFMCGSHELWK